MTRLNVVVEGQTEEAFVKQVLAPHLRSHEIYARPIVVAASRVRRSEDHVGGGGSFGKAVRTVRDTLRNDQSAYCTTMFDYYGLPSDYPGLDSDDSPPPAQLDERIDWLEERFNQKVGGTHRFIPYLQVHEFEALLFANVEVIEQAFPAESHLDDLNVIVEHFEHPEMIDDGEKTAPSKRLRALFSDYDKVLHGEMIAYDIGLPRIRNQCPHFNEWVNQLESLPSLTS